MRLAAQRVPVDAVMRGLPCQSTEDIVDDATRDAAVGDVGYPRNMGSGDDVRAAEQWRGRIEWFLFEDVQPGAHQAALGERAQQRLMAQQAAARGVDDAGLCGQG